MKLQFVAIVTAIALSTAVLTPVYAAAAAATTAASAMTAKPKMAMAKTKTPDPKRFSTEAAAQASCSTDSVVWANTKSKIFHLTGTATYGKGKNGTYMCETDATAEGFKGTKKPEKVVAAAAAATTTAKSK
jgi:hypothetical protein